MQPVEDIDFDFALLHQPMPEEYVPNNRLEMIPGGTTKGKDLLCDSFGRRYCLKSVSSATATPRWHCSKRNDKCQAVVTEVNGIFVPGQQTPRQFLNSSYHLFTKNIIHLNNANE